MTRQISEQPVANFNCALSSFASRAKLLVSHTVLATLLVMVGCASAPPEDINSPYVVAKRAFNAQPRKQTKEQAKYDQAFLNFNNLNRLDEIGDCRAKSRRVVHHILELDKNGTVVNFTPNVDNEKSRCFRSSYLGVRFPPPPYFPYYAELIL